MPLLLTTKSSLYRERVGTDPPVACSPVILFDSTVFLKNREVETAGAWLSAESYP